MRMTKGDKPLGYKAYFAKLMEELVEKAVEHYGERLCFIILFGSVAKDQHSPESDVDLLLVLDEKQSDYLEFVGFYENVEERLDTIRKMKKVGLYPVINPIFKSYKTLSVKTPYLWDSELKVLYQKGKMGDSFVTALRRYVEKHLRKKDRPITYFEVVSD